MIKAENFEARRNDAINFVDFGGLFRSPYNDPNPGGIISVSGKVAGQRTH
jgi:hypothetical protein